MLNTLLAFYFYGAYLGWPQKPVDKTYQSIVISSYQIIVCLNASVTRALGNVFSSLILSKSRCCQISMSVIEITAKGNFIFDIEKNCWKKISTFLSLLGLLTWPQINWLRNSAKLLSSVRQFSIKFDSTSARLQFDSNGNTTTLPFPLQTGVSNCTLTGRDI